MFEIALIIIDTGLKFVSFWRQIKFLFWDAPVNEADDVKFHLFRGALVSGSGVNKPNKDASI